MWINATDPIIVSLLEKANAAGCVLDYIFLERQRIDDINARHHAAAIAGMLEIDRMCEKLAIQTTSEQYPIEMFFRVNCDETKMSGKRVSLPEFWGTDDVEPKKIGNGCWSIPIVDGYKTAFFHPPYGLQGGVSGNAKLFAEINQYIFGPEPEQAEIFSWSTDWSNYFDAGHEYWGAYYWTICPQGSNQIIVIGASTSD